jgi:hypothetical protein
LTQGFCEHQISQVNLFHEGLSDGEFKDQDLWARWLKVEIVE